MNTMNELSIRDAHVSDRDAISNVTLSAYQEYGTIMPPAHWEFYRQSILATLADVKPAEQIVAERNSTILGTVLLYPAGTIIHLPDDDAITLEWPEVRLLAVTPAARGQGVGAALMQECLRRSHQTGATALTLHTTDMMQVAKGMYVRMGFERAPELDFRPTGDVIVKGYRLNLNGSETQSR